MADRFRAIPSCKGTPWDKKHEIIHTESSLPAKVDLRKKMADAHIEIYDQVRLCESLLYHLKYPDLFGTEKIRIMHSKCDLRRVAACASKYRQGISPIPTFLVLQRTGHETSGIQR
jgi:hypothetical protein